MKAFPSEGKLDLIFDGKSWIRDPNSGMDLRDYFAAEALNGYLSRMASNPLEQGPICIDMEVETNTEAIAKASYLFADAMMKAREQ